MKMMKEKVRSAKRGVLSAIAAVGAVFGLVLSAAADTCVLQVPTLNNAEIKSAVIYSPCVKNKSYAPKELIEGGLSDDASTDGLTSYASTNFGVSGNYRTATFSNLPTWSTALWIAIVMDVNGYFYYFGYSASTWAAKGVMKPTDMSNDRWSITQTCVPCSYPIVITARANNPEAGEISGGGSFSPHATETLTATPKEGYVFQCWEDGSTSPTRTVSAYATKTYTATFVHENEELLDTGFEEVFIGGIYHVTWTYDATTPYACVTESLGSPHWNFAGNANIIRPKLHTFQPGAHGGDQTVFIDNTGSISQTVHLKKAGAYRFSAYISKWIKDSTEFVANPCIVSLGDESMTFTPESTGYALVEHVFHVTSPGQYTLKIAGTTNSCRTMIDDVSLALETLGSHVYFNAAGGTGGQDSCFAVSGQTPAAVSVPTRTGYKFLGYFDASGKQYFDASGAATCAWDLESASVVLVAQWSGSASSEVSGTTFAEVAITSSTAPGTTLEDARRYVVSDNTTITGTTTPALQVASGATAILYIKKGVKLTLKGADGSGMTAGKAGLCVPADAKLIVLGEGELVAQGGAAGNGGDGGTPSRSSNPSGKTLASNVGGAGGAGGGGAAAGIGGNGSDGGAGGEGARKRQWTGGNYNESGSTPALEGFNGADGTSGASCGMVVVLGSVSVSAAPGASGTAGAGGNYSGSSWVDSNANNYTTYIGGQGGGAGGGAGNGAAFGIGGGAGGAGGGAGGGSGGYWWTRQSANTWGEYRYPQQATGGGSFVDNGAFGASRNEIANAAHGYGNSQGSFTKRDYAYTSPNTKSYGGASGCDGGIGSLLAATTAVIPSDCTAGLTDGCESEVGYAVTINLAGGEGQTSFLAYCGRPLPAVEIPTRTGYAFLGLVDANGAEVYSADGLPVDSGAWYGFADFTLTAQWEANSYTVTLNANGGTGGSANVMATYDAAMPAVTVPTRTGFAFLGYFDATEGGTKYYNADGTSAANWDKAVVATLYAQWAAAVPTPTADWTLLSGSTGGQVIGTNGTTPSYYYLTANTTCSNDSVGGSGLTIADGATVYIYVPAGVTLTCTGAAGFGKTGGGAGIHLPETSKLYLIGSGTVNATGGDAAMGEDGADGAASYYNNWTMQLWSGKGGDGGGGAGAGIGTAGGTGGAGGAVAGFSQYHNTKKEYYGTNGNDGSAGFSAADAGQLFVSPTVDVTGVKGGDAAQINTHKSAAGAEKRAYSSSHNYCLGSSAGGGNGGSGGAGNAIGAGGAGGGGGGSGGSAGASWAAYSIDGIDDRWISLNGGGGGNGTNVSGSMNIGSSAWISAYPTSLTSSYHGGNGGTGMGAGETKPGQSAQVATSPEYDIVFYKDGEVLSATTYAVGSATTIELMELAGYSWKMSVYGKSCGATSDLTVPVEDTLTGTIDARNVYGDIAFTAVADAQEVPVAEGGAKVTVEGDWLVEHGLVGKEPVEIAKALDATDETTGMKVWQNYVLNDTNAKPVIKSATKGATGKVALGVPNYTVNEKSGVTATRKLVKTVGADVTETVLALDATEIEVDEGDVSATTPVALYTTVIEFTNANGEPVKSENTVGIMYVKPEAALSIVAVPWEQIGGDDISAADLIDTRDLTDGDKLHVYDKANGKYRTWSLEGGAWNGLGTYKIDADGRVSAESAGAPESATIKRGEGVWLERGNKDKPFHLIGQYNAKAVTPTVGKGWNLCGNAGIEATSVEALGGVAEGDTVIVPTDGAPIRYTKENGNWGRYVEKVEKKTIGSRTVNVKTSEWTPDAPIGVGQGFWVVR